MWYVHLFYIFVVGQRLFQESDIKKSMFKKFYVGVRINIKKLIALALMIAELNGTSKENLTNPVFKLTFDHRKNHGTVNNLSNLFTVRFGKVN